MRDWFDNLDPYIDDEEETEDYIPFKYNPWEEEEPNHIRVRAPKEEENEADT